MSKKNSSVILKEVFKNNKDILEVFLRFKNQITKLNKRSIAVAISGGPDSLALSALAKALSLEKKIKFYFVLVNHNIRKNSKNEANQVKKLLKKYKINLKILNNSKKISKNIQSQARQVRYEMLLKFCKTHNIKIILTGHNLEDQVETFFIRLSRGSGLTGLSSMKTLTNLNKQIKLYRPMLSVKKNTLVRISKKVFGKFFIDPSNNNSKYLRTKIRNLKRPLSKSGIKYDQIIKSINNLESSRAALDEYFIRASKGILIYARGTVSLNLSKFNSLNNELKIRLINESIKRLKNNYYDQRSKKVVNLINLINFQDFKKANLGGCLFFRKKDNLCVKLEKKH